MGDTVNALELAGLAQIGRGETAVNIFKGITKTLKVKFNKLGSQGRVIKKGIQKYLFPAKNLFHKDSLNEFTDLDSWPFLPPLDRGLKTKLGVYLDTLTKNYPSNSAVFFDDKMNIYIQDKKNPTKYQVYKTTSGVIEDAGEYDYIEPDYNIKVKQMESEPLSNGLLKDASKVVERQLRALQRDAERTYKGKKVTLKDENPYSIPELDANLAKKKARAHRAGVTVPLIHFDQKGESLETTLERTRKLKGGLNFNAFDLLNDAAKYEEWIHTGGASRALIGYEIQDIENQIKVIKALSNDKIRKIAVNVINRALIGDDLTFTDLYRDIQRISGIGPVQIDANMLRLKGGDIRDTAEVYDDLVKEITKYAPSTKRIFADQTLYLAGKAAMGAGLKYIPKVGGFISGAISAIGGSVGLLTGWGLQAIAALTMVSYAFIRNRRISQETQERDKKELQNLLTKTVEEMSKEFSKRIEQSNENFEKLINKVLDDRKNERISADEAGLARARIEHQKALNQVGSDVVNESQIILSKEMMPMPQRQYPYADYINEGRKIKMYFRDSTGKVRNITSSIYINRNIVDDYKNRLDNKRLAQMALRRGSPPEIRIAFIERMLQSPVGVEGPVVYDVSVDHPNNLIPTYTTTNVFTNDPNAVIDHGKILREISAFATDTVKNVAIDSLKDIASKNVRTWFGSLPAPSSSVPRPPRKRKRPIIEPVDDNDALALPPVEENPFAIHDRAFGPEELEALRSQGNIDNLEQGSEFQNENISDYRNDPWNFDKCFFIF